MAFIVETPHFFHSVSLVVTPEATMQQSIHQYVGNKKGAT
jgi:hypothetical protein